LEGRTVKLEDNIKMDLRGGGVWRFWLDSSQSGDSAPWCQL